MRKSNDSIERNSDSSFDEEFSIFSKPLKDLPVLNSMKIMYDFNNQEEPLSKQNYEDVKIDEQNYENEDSKPKLSPFELLMSL